MIMIGMIMIVVFVYVVTYVVIRYNDRKKLKQNFDKVEALLNDHITQ